MTAFELFQILVLTFFALAIVAPIVALVFRKKKVLVSLRNIAFGLIIAPFFMFFIAMFYYMVFGKVGLLEYGFNELVTFIFMIGVVAVGISLLCLLILRLVVARKDSA